MIHTNSFAKALKVKKYCIKARQENYQHLHFDKIMATVHSGNEITSAFAALLHH
jgi:hypothetical protein